MTVVLLKPNKQSAYAHDLTGSFISSLSSPCSASYSREQPSEFSSEEADHPVFQMWRAMQGRGAASPGQPLPHKVLYLQG